MCISKSNVAFQHLELAARDKNLTWRVYFLAKSNLATLFLCSTDFS